MSLQSLKKSIDEVTEQRIAAILAEAKEKAAEIIKEADHKAEALKKELVGAKKSELEVQERSELAMEELKWKKRLLNTKAEVLDKVFQEAEKKLSGMVTDTRYKEFLKNAVVEAILQVPGSEAVVSVNKRDKVLLKRLIKDVEKEVKRVKGSKVNIEISNDPVTTIGGVLCHTKDMRKYYNNTIEARIIRSKTQLKGKLYNTLFGGE